MTSQPKRTYLTPEAYPAAPVQCALAPGEVGDKVGLPPSDLKEGELLWA
jgi:hypothetical protein